MIVDLDRRETDHPSLSASFYHSNSRLLIEVEEDNDRIYSSTRLSFIFTISSLSVALSSHSSFLTPLFFPFYSHPILTVRESLSDDLGY